MISSNTRILQVNLNRSSAATESVLQLAIELKIDLILVQEPWIISENPDYSNSRSISHSSFSQILPTTIGFRPRTFAYISKTYIPSVTLASSSIDPDLLVLLVAEESNTLELVNIYNETSQIEGNSSKTVERSLLTSTISANSLILGDFNLHYPWWNPNSRSSQASTRLVRWIEEQNLELINEPGTIIFFRGACESVLDLTLATQALAGCIDDWQVLADLGSDHLPILFTLKGKKELVPPNGQKLASIYFNTKLADWELFSDYLVKIVKESTILASPPPDFTRLGLKLDEVAQNYLESISSELLSLVQLVASKAIPKTKPSLKAKPW
jgi:hypothetical protein